MLKDISYKDFSIIKGTEIEKVLLPSGTSDIKSGNYNTSFVGKENSIINALLDNTEISIKASGLADDTLTLNQTSTHWGADFVAKHVGNNGVGAVDEEILREADVCPKDGKSERETGQIVLVGLFVYSLETAFR